MAASMGMARGTIGAMERGTHPIELRTELAVGHVVESRTRAHAPDPAAVVETAAHPDPPMRMAGTPKPILDGWYQPRSE